MAARGTAIGCFRPARTRVDILPMAKARRAVHLMIPIARA